MATPVVTQKVYHRPQQILAHEVKNEELASTRQVEVIINALQEIGISLLEGTLIRVSLSKITYHEDDIRFCYCDISGVKVIYSGMESVVLNSPGKTAAVNLPFGVDNHPLSMDVLLRFSDEVVTIEPALLN